MKQKNKTMNVVNDLAYSYSITQPDTRHLNQLFEMPTSLHTWIRAANELVKTILSKLMKYKTLITRFNHLNSTNELRQHYNVKIIIF